MDLYSYRTESYAKDFKKLSTTRQESANQAFLKWVRDEGAGGRRLNMNSDVISVKIGEGDRALGVIIDTPKPNALAVVWFFVGKHSDYEHLMKASRLDDTLAQIKNKLPKYRAAIDARQGLVKAKLRGPA